MYTVEKFMTTFLGLMVVPFRICLMMETFFSETVVTIVVVK
jgi:hypothetical protein